MFSAKSTLLAAATASLAAASSYSIYNSADCSGNAIQASTFSNGGCVVYGSYSSVVTCNANNTAGTTMTYDGTTCAGDSLSGAMPFTSNECTTLGGDVYYKVVCTSGNSASAMDAGLVASAVAGVGAALMAWL